MKIVTHQKELWGAHFQETAGMIAEAKARPEPDETPARIMDTAEWLFRRFGSRDVSINDIAAEVGMSPGSVCRFFPTKDAIIEAISRRHLGDLEEVAKARVPNSAVARMERLILQILTHNRKRLLSEQRVHDIVLDAVEHGRDTVEIQQELVRSIAEMILRDGIEYHLTRTTTVDVRR